MPGVQVMEYGAASAYDILWSDTVVVEEAALTGVVPELTDEETAAEAAPKKKTTKGAKAAATRAPKTAAKKAAKKATKAKAAKPAKKAAKKPAAAKAKKPAPKKKGGK
jgi:hypothetical protein